MDYSQYAVPVLLVIFVLYRRIKRSIGFQAFQPRRLVIRSIILFVVAVLLLAVSAMHPISYLYDAGGGLLGIILVALAIKWSKFEMRKETIFYRTHIWIESAVLCLFLGRFFYRFFYLLHFSSKQTALASNQADMQYTKDPSTLGVFFLLAVYYIGFYVYVLRKAKSIEQEKGLPAG